MSLNNIWAAPSVDLDSAIIRPCCLNARQMESGINEFVRCALPKLFSKSAFYYLVQLFVHRENKS